MALALWLCFAAQAGDAALAGSASSPARPAPTAEPAAYTLQPGDLIEVSVWKEPDLQREVLIRPDGGMSFPLAGEITTTGMTVEGLRTALTSRLERYIPKPVVTIGVKTIGGNRIYVVGKVTKAGEYLFSRPVDVMQALAMAGGATEFAALNDIVILRRENGQLTAIRFRYGDVSHGKDLAQDVLLHSGDTVVVP